MEVAAQRLMGFQQRRGSAYIVKCNRQRSALERQHRALIEGALVMRCSPTDLSVRNWMMVLQLLTSQQLSCSATVSSGSVMGNMMQQFEKEL